MKVYQCKYCGVTLQAEGFPLSGGCPKNGTHAWLELCSDCLTVPKEGYSPYQCSKCGTLVYSHHIPYGAICPAGGIHSWNRLS